MRRSIEVPHETKPSGPVRPKTLVERIQVWDGEIVVVDCASPFVIVGTLLGATAEYVELCDADMHDLRDTSTNRELYLVKTARHGVEPNRASLLLRMADVVGISRLADVAIE